MSDATTSRSGATAVPGGALTISAGSTTISARASVEERAAAAARRHRLEVYHFAVAVVAFGLAAVMGVMQSLTRTGVHVPFQNEAVYYMSMTAHGVLMAIVFTTFFIMGLGYVLLRETLGRIELEGLAWASWWVAVIGTAMTGVAIASGTSTVLYTFYPPLKAHWSFYLGATLVVVGSWGFCAVVIASYRAFRKANPGRPVPLAVHGILTTVIIWLLATTGLAVEDLTMLLPWSLGLIQKIDPLIARTWFWWFGHPLVYFWLLPAYVIWYTVLPRVAGGRLFSDPIARAVFVMFILFSTPVGFHHQFGDPGIGAGWKLAHSVATYIIIFPSLVTAFAVIASLETAGRIKGARGLFDWLGKLPWSDPLFASVALAMLTFAIGGFGGAINAAYAMNGMVHNTAFIQGHFHLTVGTAVALTFLGACYWLLPRLLGRELRFRRLAQAQPYLWFAGMMMFSLTNHVTGLQGMPRRLFAVDYQGAAVARQWQGLTELSAAGGVVLFLSSLCFLAVVIATAFWGRRIVPPPIELAVPLSAPVTTRGVWDRFGLWAAIAVLLIAVAYAYPIYHLYAMHRFGSVGFQPF
jgi:cytochrome c oxidase subunit I